MNKLGGRYQGSAKILAFHQGPRRDLEKGLLTGNQGVQFGRRHGSVDPPVVIPPDPPVNTPPSKSKIRKTHVGKVTLIPDNKYKVDVGGGGQTQASRRVPTISTENVRT